jgi:hypothetical protein
MAGRYVGQIMVRLQMGYNAGTTSMAARLRGRLARSRPRCISVEPLRDRLQTGLYCITSENGNIHEADKRGY